MRKLILCLLAAVTIPKTGISQVIYGFYPIDSSYVNFNTSSIHGYLPDTGAAPLWQIGLTHKPFFADDTIGTTAIMTDTLHPYPISANNSFTLKLALGFNMIFKFWHRFQTDSVHAGGLVEFSTDAGASWQNIKGECNADSTGFTPGVFTTNFYTFADTLFTGEPAFTGNSLSTQVSAFQFFLGYPVKTTTPTCTFYQDSILIRFRFISDTTADTLAGWMIDSMKIEQDYYGSSVASINKVHSLHVYPTPSHDGLFTFPPLDDEQSYKIEVFDALGDRIINLPYTHSLGLTKEDNGVYFYRVFNGTDFYSGQLIKE